MNKKIKKVILIIIVLIIIIGILLVVNKYKSVKDDDNSQLKEVLDEISLKKINNTETLYMVQNCTKKYFYLLNSLWTDNSKKRVFSTDEIIDQNSQYQFNEFCAQQLLHILAEDYVQGTNLTEDSIKSKYEYFEQSKIIINNVYQYNVENGINLFIVRGYNINGDGTNKADFIIMVVIDENKNSFKIYPQDYVEKEKLDKLKIGDKINITKKIKNINQNNYNKITKQKISDVKVAEDYFYLYKFNMKYDRKAAYDMLNEEYRQKRFGSFEKYDKYIEDNYLDLISVMQGYSVEKQEKNTQYMCTDKNGYYFIFNQGEYCLDYDVVLDCYTVDLPAFVKKYKNSTNQEKVALNIQKVVQALNEKNYTYVFSKLAEEFKANYFETYEEFEKYAKENFETGNTVELSNYTESNEVSTYNITLSGKGGIINKLIAMKLQDGTDFVMSFDVD